MVTQYEKPLLPKMHYVQPISVRHIDWLRFMAMQVVAAKLSWAEPPLRKEKVEYMLDMDYHVRSLRRSKANFHRLTLLLSGISNVCRRFDDICHWKKPPTTILVLVLFLILIRYPELILPTIFLYLFVIGLWKYRLRPKHPPHMDARLSQAENAHPDELDEEYDTFPTSRETDIVRMRYDRLRSVAGRVQSVTADLATRGKGSINIELEGSQGHSHLFNLSIDLGCVFVCYSIPSCGTVLCALLYAPSLIQRFVHQNLALWSVIQLPPQSVLDHQAEC